jgi:hypothetical protein
MTITKQDLIDLGCDSDHVDDWFTIRKAKKKPLTETALKLMRTEAGKAGLTLPQAVQKCAEEGWLGFKAFYIKTPVKMTVLAPESDRTRVRDKMRDITDTDW